MSKQRIGPNAAAMVIRRDSGHAGRCRLETIYGFIAGIGVHPRRRIGHDRRTAKVHVMDHGRSILELRVIREASRPEQLPPVTSQNRVARGIAPTSTGAGRVVARSVVLAV